MKVLMLHCRYTQAGGEDGSTAAEVAMLRTYGHDVHPVYESNAEIIDQGVVATLRALWQAPWNRSAYARIRETVRTFRPDIMHVQNFWFALSPSVFAAAHDEGVPTVMSLRNYRLICPAWTLLRNGKICEKCVGTTTWHAVPLRCYRGSALQTAAVSRTIESNRRWGTWAQGVDSYITLTEFARQKFITGGLPAKKIQVKPNFLASDPGVAPSLGTGAVYIGRLSPEKGVQVLLDAWLQVQGQPLTIVGDGPDREALEAYAQQHEQSRVRFLGHLEVAACLALIKEAQVVIMPSLWYETFGRVIIEAYGCGKPVIASRLGAMAELVHDNTTGLLFTPGDAGDLAVKLRHLLSNPELCQTMGVAARRAFERDFTAAENYTQLMRIYEGAISGYRGTGGRRQ